MQSFKLVKSDGWVQVSTGTVCRLQVLSGWHPGALRVNVGTSMPDNNSPYFEVVQGEYFIKTSGGSNVYVYAVSAGNDYPSMVTTSDETDGVTVSGGGGGGTSDASAANQTLMINELVDINTKVATEATQEEVLSAVQLLTRPADTQIVDQVSVKYASSYIRTTTTGSIVNASSITIVNIGAAPGTVTANATDGDTPLDAGDTVNLSAPLNGVVDDVTYDATDTEFVIVTMTLV